jgi:hypothetical protein
VPTSAEIVTGRWACACLIIWARDQSRNLVHCVPLRYERRAIAASRCACSPVARGTAADDPQNQARMGAFLQGLQQLGWIDGRSVRIDTRWPAGDAADTRKYAAELVALSQTRRPTQNRRKVETVTCSICTK